MENINSQIISKNSDISYEAIMALKEPELTEALNSIKLDKNQNLIDKDKCFNNLLNNNNIYKNYLYLIKINQLHYYDKTSFDINNVEKIYNKFKEIFEEYKVLKEKNINDIDKVNGQEITSSYFSDLKIPEIKILLRNFFKVLLSIYDNEEELIKFIIENKEHLEINNRKDFEEYFKDVFIHKKINFINLYEMLLKDIDSKKKIFSKKEEYQFYEYLLSEYNHLKNNVDYILKKENFCEIINYENIENIEHLDKYFLLFNIQEKEEVINEMMRFLYHLYISKDNIKLLLKQLKEKFYYIKNMNIIKLYMYIIKEIEKGHVVKTKSHFSLCKKSIITLKFGDKDEKLYFYGNTTINEIYDYLNKKYESKKEYFDINLKKVKENQNLKKNILILI